MTDGSLRSALAGGSKRELRNEPVIHAVLADRGRVSELFTCVLDDDEYVRILKGMARVDQPSVQWHFAQIVATLPLTPGEQRGAIRILKRNLEISRDWIVLNCSMQALAQFAQHDAALRRYLVPILDELGNDHRKSVASMARRLHGRLSAETGARRARPTRPAR